MNSILNGIAIDMKKETETSSERRSGLEQYWGATKRLGREAVLSTINADKIAEYKERLRDQALDTTARIRIPSIPVYSHRVVGGTWNSSKSQAGPY
jgi:pyruvate carboxylase